MRFKNLWYDLMNYATKLIRPCLYKTIFIFNFVVNTDFMLLIWIVMCSSLFSGKPFAATCPIISPYLYKHQKIQKSALVPLAFIEMVIHIICNNFQNNKIWAKWSIWILVLQSAYTVNRQRLLLVSRLSFLRAVTKTSDEDDVKKLMITKMRQKENLPVKRAVLYLFYYQHWVASVANHQVWRQSNIKYHNQISQLKTAKCLTIQVSSKITLS
jgi:hypothetical protein